jgi:hypothetical protein
MARAPRVTIHADDEIPAAPPPTPSEKLVQASIKAQVLKDSRGRKLSVRKPDVLAQFRLIEALGDTASNQSYVQMTMPLIYLGAIGDDPVFPPQNKIQIEALISELGDDGLSTLMGWYMETIVAPTVNAIQDAERRASLKN